MPASESFLDTTLVKRLAIVNACVPAALLVWDAYRHQLGVNEVNFAIRTTGLIGLILITLALVITPLRALTGWNRLIAMRRNFGVIGFFYLASHFLIFFWFDRGGSVASTLTEIVTRKYLWFGTTAVVLMIPLALTSTDRMVQWVGARRWKRLQRLAYVIAIAGQDDDRVNCESFSPIVAHTDRDMPRGDKLPFSQASGPNPSVLMWKSRLGRRSWSHHHEEVVAHVRFACGPGGLGLLISVVPGLAVACDERQRGHAHRRVGGNDVGQHRGHERGLDHDAVRDHDAR